MRHLSRTVRINLDGLFERIDEDPSIRIKYINTKMQLADILKGELQCTTMECTTSAHTDQTLSTPVTYHLGNRFGLRRDKDKIKTRTHLWEWWEKDEEEEEYRIKRAHDHPEWSQGRTWNGSERKRTKVLKILAF